jgi:hypothetical protein
MGMTAGWGTTVGSGMTDLLAFEQMYEQLEDLSSEADHGPADRSA